MYSSTETTPVDVSCCVILAAGEGRRLSTLGNGSAKPVTQILGLSLGERSMLACMGAGINRFVIVLGSQAEAVRTHFEDVAGRARVRSRVRDSATLAARQRREHPRGARTGSVANAFSWSWQTT